MLGIALSLGHDANEEKTQAGTITAATRMVGLDGRVSLSQPPDENGDIG